MVVRSAGGAGSPSQTGGGDVRVAAGYVEVSARIDHRRQRDAARRAGTTAGGGFAQAFSGSATGSMAAQRGRMVRSFGQVGGQVGGGFAAAAARSMQRDSSRITQTAGRIGQHSSQGFATGVATGLAGAQTQRQLGAAFGAAGGQAAQQFTRDANGRLRDSRGHFVRQGSDIGGALAVGLAGTGGQLGAALGGAGAEAGERFTRGADGRLRDSRGHFVKEGERLGGALVGGVDGSGARAGIGFKTGFGSGIAGFGMLLNPVVGAVGLAAGLMGAQVLGVGMAFEASMQNVAAVSGATGQELSQLSDLAREMGATTQFSASEAADALGYLSMAGFSVQESMDSLPGVLNLAAAGGLDLAEAADIASNVLSGFGLKVNQLGRLNDVLAKASSSANTNVQQLGAAFQYVGPVASAAGMSLEETAATLGMMADAGIQGEQGGTALRGALSRLLQPTKAVQDKLDALGVTIDDGTGKMRPFADIMGDLEGAGADVSDMLTIFGVEAGPAMLAVLERGAGDLRTFTGELENAEGAAAEMAAIKMEGLAGQVKGARSAIEGLWLAIGDMGVLSGAASLVGVFTGAIRGLTGFLEEHSETITSVLGVVGTFAGIVAAAVGIFLAAKGAVAGFAAAFGLLSNPVGWTILAIGAVGTALVTAWRRSTTFRTILVGAWEAVQRAGGRARDFFGRYIWPGLVWGWERLEDVAGTVGGWLVGTLFPALVGGWRQFRDATEPHVNRIVGWLRWLRDNSEELGDRWGFLWDFAGERLDLFGELIGSWADNAVAQFEGWIDIITGLMSGDWGQVWDGAQKILSSGWDHLVTTATVGAKLLWGALKLQFIELPRAIAGWLVEVGPVIERKARTEWIPAFADWVVDAERELRAELTEWLVRFGLWLAGVPGTIRENLPDWTQEFITWGAELWADTEERLDEFKASLRTWIEERAAELPEQLDTWTTQVTTWAGGLWDRTLEGIDGFGLRFTEWMEAYAESLPERLENWTTKVTTWIEGVAEGLPARLDAWSVKFAEWIEVFADSLPDRLKALTQRFVAWATGAPAQTADSFEEADGPGKIERQIEQDWGPRLLAAFGRAIGTLILSIPGMVARVGWALMASFGSILWELSLFVGEQFVNLGKTAQRHWAAIKEAIVAELVSLGEKAKEQLDLLHDNTIGRFQDMYDTLVGNSIVPDMVRDIIAETDKLAPGVGGGAAEMNRQAAKEAALMAAAMATQMVTMATAVVSAMVGMRTRVAASNAAMSRDFGFSIATTAVRVHQAYQVMASGLVAITRQMAANQGGVLAALTVATVRAFSVMGHGATTEFSQMVRKIGRDGASLVTAMNRVFSLMSSNTIGAFRRTVRGVGREWSGLRKVTADPVRYLISPVYNTGLRGVWNRVASKVPGLSGMPAMAMPRFQDGGLVDMRRGGVQPGYSRTDNRLALFRDGEGVLTPEATGGLGGKAFIDAANRLGGNAFQLLMKGVGAFSEGGVVGLVNQFAAAKKGYFKDGAPEAAKAALGPMAEMVGNRYGRGQTLPGSAYHQARAWAGAITDVVAQHKALLEGGDGMAVVAEAKKHIGKSGRPNEFMRPYMGGSWPWCGAFVGTTFKRAGAYDALDAVPWKPLVRSYRNLPRTADPMPGSLALYRSDDGHINIVEDPERGTTIGGNESDSVRRQTGYMRSASSYRQPAFADGGMVDRRASIDLSEIARLSDLAAFWNQDRAETASLLEGDRTRTLRSVFPAHLRDTGGLLPDRSAAVNMSGQMETVQTLDQLKAQAQAGSGMHIDTVNVYVQSKDFDDMKKVTAVFEDLRPVSRMHGSKTHVGAP
jgi:TP901 family phage tail tape measure protein